MGERHGLAGIVQKIQVVSRFQSLLPICAHSMKFKLASSLALVLVEVASLVQMPTNEANRCQLLHSPINSKLQLSAKRIDVWHEHQGSWPLNSDCPLTFLGQPSLMIGISAVD